MKIVLDGKFVDAVQRAGSEIWDFANGEVRQLQQDYSAGANVFKTFAVLKEAQLKIVAENLEGDAKNAANTIQQKAEGLVGDLKNAANTVKSEVAPKAQTFFQKVEAEVKKIEGEIVDGVHTAEEKVKGLFEKG